PYAWGLVNTEGSPIKGKVGIKPALAEDSERGGGTLGGYQLAVNANTPSWKREAAWKLVQYLSSTEIQVKIGQAYGFKPTRTAVSSAPASLAVEPFAKELFPVLERARPRPVTPYYLMMSQVLQSEFSAVVAGIRTPEKAMKTASQQLEMVVGEGK